MNFEKKNYNQEFMHLFHEVSSLFTLDKYSQGLIPGGKSIKADPFLTVWDMLEKIKDYDFVDIGKGKYVPRRYLFRTPTRILFLILISEFERRLYRAVEYNSENIQNLNEKNLNDLIRLFFEKYCISLQKEYLSKREFKEDLKAISSFRNVVVHFNKKFEGEMNPEILIKRKRQILKALKALQQITDKLKLRFLKEKR